MGEMHRHDGRCHCGALELRLETSRPAGALPLRACACDFCRRHAVRAVADPEGRVRFLVRRLGALQRYRFGLATADFLLCRTCGCYLGALLGADDGAAPGAARATINVNCLDNRADFAAALSEVSYDHEDEAGRRARRRAGWTPAELVTHEQDTGERKV